MEDEDSERQRKLKAGREKLLQFQQKKRGIKKKKKASSKSAESDSATGDSKDQVKEHVSEHGASSPANSEQDVSIASVDTDKDISSIASEVGRTKIPGQEQHFAPSGEESNAGSFASGSYTSGEDSYTSEDGGVDDLVIANLERNELKSRNVELEEQLAAKTTALRDIGKENAELRTKLDNIKRASSPGEHATIVLDLNEKNNSLEKAIMEKQSTVNTLQSENDNLRKIIEDYQGLDRSESSAQVEELKGKLVTKQETLNELNKQNEELSKEVYNLKVQLESPKDDSNVQHENLRMKENALQQLSIENENQRQLIKTLEDGLNQSKTQLLQFHSVLQEKDQELSQMTSLRTYTESMKHNITQLNEQLMNKNQQIQVICHDRDQRLWHASQEIERLKQALDGSKMTIPEEYQNKISEIVGQLAEKDNALENMKNQLMQTMSSHKQSEEELLVLKSHSQEQIQQLLLSQEELSSSRSACKEREEKIAILEQQLSSLSEVYKETSQGAERAGQQILEHQNLLNDRNEKISRLEITLSEVSEERELMRNEMQKQSHELIDQIKDLHNQLNESNAKVKEQSDEMENSFSELHATQDMIRDLQKEMLEKDLSLDNLSQKLQTTENEHKEVLENLQEKFIKEKDRIQNELNIKEKMLNELHVSFSEIQQQLIDEKSVGVDLSTKIADLNVDVENAKNEATNLGRQLAIKEGAFEDLERGFDETKQKHHEEIESLKLELEKVKETAPDYDRKIVELSENYEEQVKRLQQHIVGKESRVEELVNEIHERDQKIVSLELQLSENLQHVETVQNQLSNTRLECDEAKASLENQQDAKAKLMMELDQVRSQHQNENIALIAQHADEMTALKKELDEKIDELESSRSFTESRCEQELTKATEKHAEEMESFHAMDKELEIKLKETEQQLKNASVNEENSPNLIEQLEHQREEYEKAIKLSETLSLERNELLAREDGLVSEREGLLTDKINLENQLELLSEKITTLENELQKSQENEGHLSKEKEKYEELLRNSEGANAQEVLSLNEKLRLEEQKHEDKVAMLDNNLREWQQKHDALLENKVQVEEKLKVSEEKLRLKEDEIGVKDEELREQKEELLEKKEELREKEEKLLKKKEELREKGEELRENEKERCEKEEQMRQKEEELREKKRELHEKEEEHGQEIKQLDDQLEQTRKVIETIRMDNENKIADLKEAFNRATEELQNKLQRKEDEHEELVWNMKNKNEELKRELEKQKSDGANMKEQLESLVEEKEFMATNARELENFDWTSNSFETEPLVEEHIVASENWMESETIGDGPSLFSDEQSSQRQDEERQQAHEVDLPQRRGLSQEITTDHLDSLQQISILQEKLAEKEKSELELIEEKNKLLKIVKEYNDSLATERDSLKEKIILQDQTIQELQEQLSTSELVSSDLQEVFGRQLLVLQEQRDSLLGQLEEQKKDRTSFVDILEEKHALEENLRSEKEQLADKLRQKDVLEAQLEHERAALQEQLIRQARLNEIIKEKDALEVELIEQKNTLEKELRAIENSLTEKEQLLQKEKETLQAELLEKDRELDLWEGEFKTKEQQLIEERERLEKAYTDTLLATRTELEDTYQQSLEHLRTELDFGYKQRLFQMEEDFQSHHEEEMASLSRQHEKQVTGLKAEYEEKIENLKGILEEQRRKQVSTMKNVLERDRENEVEQLMDGHGNDMEELRKELNMRHQDIVNAIVSRLKRSHEQEMEDCLANAVTDTVLKVEIARLEVEREYDAKFHELREKTKQEIKNLNKKHEKETTELREMNQIQADKIEQLQKRDLDLAEELRKTNQNELDKADHLERQKNIDLTKELTEEHEKITAKKLDELRKKLTKEHEENLEQLREEIEMQYEVQMESLQDELESKHENSLREFREELDKQARDVTASAVDELQQRHFSEINTLKSEHEHILEQMNNVREKIEASYKEDIRDLEEKLKEGKGKLKEMESQLEMINEESKRNESERIDLLRSTTTQKITFLEQENESKIGDMQREMEKKLKEKDHAFHEELQRVRDEVEEEKMAIELKHLNELQEISADADKRIAEKEQEHVNEIDKLQQKLILLREDGEEARFHEVDEIRKQLSEKYQRDLDAIVRELKLQHQKQIDTLISEAESNQIDNQLEEFERWKANVIEKHEKEMADLRNEHQRELDAIRKLVEQEKLEEVTKATSTLSVKNAREMEELRKQITKEYEEEYDKMKIENQSKYEKDIMSLSVENQMIKQQHEEALNDLQEKLTKTLAQEVEPVKKELRIYKDLVQEKESEIETMKRDHEKEIKEIKQRHFDDILEEVSQVRSDLALDAAREVELVKMESEYALAKKVKEIQDAGEDEMSVYAAKLESIEKEKESLNEFLRKHAQETLELKRQLEEEKKGLLQAHDEAIQDLRTKLDVEQQNALNELKVKLMNEMDRMQLELKNESEEEHQKLKDNFMQRESQLNHELKGRDEMLENLKQDHEKELVRLTETLNHENQATLDQLREDHENKIRNVEEKFTLELKSEKERLEMEKVKDLSVLKEALNGSMNEQRELQLKLVNEQHSRELEALREELVRTHMEKFTLMTEQLEQGHQEELDQVRQRVQESTQEEFQTKLKEAEERARYDIEQEHLENLKQLEENLMTKHEGQLSALNDLIQHHQGQLKKLNEEHEIEKQKIINGWQEKLSDELETAKKQHDRELTLKDDLLDKAETEIKRYVLEIDTKDKNVRELTEFIETANAKYEERLAKIRKEFDQKLQEMNSSVGDSNEAEIRGIQELLSRQHADELERLKEGHEKHIELLNNELEVARVSKERMREESDQKLTEYTARATEEEQLLKTQIDQLEARLASNEQDTKKLEERNHNIQSALEEKEKTTKELEEQKQAAEMQCRTLEGTVREMMNRHEREKLEDANMIKMLSADLDALNSERDSLQRAKENLLRQLSAVVRNTLVTEETINTRLETLLEQTVRMDGEENGTISEVNSISEMEDSIREGFRRRQLGAPSLATSTPAVAPPATVARVRYDDDVNGENDAGDSEDDRTLTDDGMKQHEGSLVSDEGLELSAVLSENIQGSLDLQNEEAVLDTGNRLRIAVQKVLDMVASVTQQLKNARSTQDEFLNTTAQRTAEVNQLTQAQEILMTRLQKEIQSKDDVTNRLRKAEEDMEAHIAEIDRLENLQKAKSPENEEKPAPDEISVEKRREMDVLEKEKEELLKNVEYLKSKTENMEKSYEKEKHDLCEKIKDLQQKLAHLEEELKTKNTLEAELQKSDASYRQMSKGRDDHNSNEIAEERPVLSERDNLLTMIETLKLECSNRETENERLKDVQQELQSEVSSLEQSKLELESKLHDSNEERLQLQQRYEEKINRFEIPVEEKQDALRKTEDTDDVKVVETSDNDSNDETSNQEVNSLKATVQRLTDDLHRVAEENVLLQKTFEQREVEWEEEKNTLQQQLYDSCLEASSFKEKLNSKTKEEAGSVAELKDKLSEQTQAYKKLENDAITLQDSVKDLRGSLSLKENEIIVLSQNIQELKETLASQQNILDQKCDSLTQAENAKIADEEKICALQEAIADAEKKVEEGEVKMQEILTNMKNVEDTFKAQTVQVTERLNKKVEVLQKELSETKTKLEQQKNQSNFSVMNHIAELKQQHDEEIQSLRTQFEVDLQDAIERANANAENNHGGYTTEHDSSTNMQENFSDFDSTVGTRLNVELMNVDSFTSTIAGYLSDFPTLRQSIFDQQDVSDNSTSEKIETILGNVKVDADAIYSLVNSLPPFYDANVKSVQMAWREEKEILVQAIKQLKEIANQRPDETAKEEDWRTTILNAVLDLLNKEEQMLSSELQAMELLTRTDALATSKLVKRRQQKQDELHRQSVEKLYQSDRISLMNEISELQNTLAAVKEELTHENKKLQEQLERIQEQVQKREKELLQQVATREKVVRQERDVINGLRTEREADRNRLHEANDLIKRERLLVKDLQDVLNNSKTRLKVLEAAVEKEKTETAVIQTCLDSERARCTNLEEALKHERMNVESQEREIEQKNKLLQDISVEKRENVEKLKTAVLHGKEQLSELQTQLKEERARNTQLKNEIVNKQNTFASDKEKQNNIIKSLKEQLGNEESRNDELIKSLNVERNASEELRSTLGSVSGVKEQIAEQEQLITELSQALEKERMVNEELRNALDNEYETFDKTDDQHLNVVKELQTSLTAVQNQLQNQIEVVDQERNRAKRLRKERDIHEATAMGAKDKEQKLEKDLEMQKVAHDVEIRNLKDVIERKISEKKNLEETISQRNTEFELLCKELQRLKDERKTEQRKTPTSPPRERLNVLRHDLKSLIDEHRVLLIMHKDYLNQQSNKTPNSTDEMNNLRDHVENLLSEMDRMKIQLNTILEGPSIPLSPTKAAAYERIAKQNKELADYVAKLSEEKAELRVALTRLELQISEHQEREARLGEQSRQHQQGLESSLTAERSRFAQERLTMHQTVAEYKRRITEIENKLRDKESKFDAAKRSLRIAEAELEEYKETTKRLQSAEDHNVRWTPTRIQKLYGKYMRAEKSRKSLAYQKKYLVLMLGGFRESEAITLSLIAKMGAYPSFQEPPSRFTPAFTKFRTAVRVVIAIKRMALLVKKSKNSLRQVIESTDRITLKNNGPSEKYSPGRRSREPLQEPPGHPQVSRYPNSFPTSVVEMNAGNHSRLDDRPHQFAERTISSESCDISFAMVRAHSSRTPSPVHDMKRGDFRRYTRYDDKMSDLSTSSKYGASSARNILPIRHTTSYLPKESETSSIQSTFHSPPVKEGASNNPSSWSGVRQPFSVPSYPYRGETRSQLDSGNYRHDDSQDLERKIQTLDSLQQKLSASRGLSYGARRF